MVNNTQKTAYVWGAIWRSSSKRDGCESHILRNANYVPAVFETRREARQWIEDHYGYIRRRPELRAEPHGWKMPLAVRVKVTWQNH